MKELKEGLSNVLVAMAELPDIYQEGEVVQEGTINFISYLQKRLIEEQIAGREGRTPWAKDIVRGLELLLKDPQTPPEVVSVIIKIFFVMDERDKDFRFGN